MDCKNEGICKKSEGGYPYCDCPVAYEGETCQFTRGIRSFQTTSLNVKSFWLIWFQTHTTINLVDSCSRGNVSCENAEKDAENCCNDKNCDLDRIKSLPWNSNLGLNHGCYKRCDQNECYETGIDTYNLIFKIFCIKFEFILLDKCIFSFISHRMSQA